MRLLAITLILATVSPAARAPALPLPEGWRKEHIDFPLDFAPSLAYKGYEELRFTPGMFKPEAEDYFSYAFLWWLQGAPSFAEESLRRDLVAYFQGLAEAVGRKKEPVVKTGATSGRVSRRGARSFHAEIRTVDAFNGARPLELALEITIPPSSADGHTAVLFVVAPKQASEAVRASLRKVVAEALASWKPD